MNIQHPKHYTSGKYEVIDIIHSICDSLPITPFQGYLQGNIIKYLCRWKHKGGVEDLGKAKVYLNWLIGEGENENNK